MTIKLNESNCKEYTNEEFEAKIIEVAAKNMKKEVKKLHNVMKVHGWKSEEGRIAGNKESVLYVDFLEKYGSDALSAYHTGRITSFARLQNSKGNGYGNF